MIEPPTRRLTIGGETFVVKFHGARSDGPTAIWSAVTVIARDEAGRAVCGHSLAGSPGVEVAGLSGTGPTPEEAYRDLEQKLAMMKSCEPGPA